MHFCTHHVPLLQWYLVAHTSTVTIYLIEPETKKRKNDINYQFFFLLQGIIDVLNS